MPGVFPLNDFSQPNAHGRLPRDLLTAPFTPPSLSPHHLFHLRLYATPQNRPPTPPDGAPPPRAQDHGPPPSLHVSPGPTAPSSRMQVKALLLHFWVQRSN